MLMASEALYALAFRFRKAKLWNRLLDDELFAVQLSDGEIGYCCVMGQLGEHLSLALYVGETGLQSYLRLAAAAARQEVEQELVWSQDCLQCSFEDAEELNPADAKDARSFALAQGVSLRGRFAYPLFSKYSPYRIPCAMSDALDFQRMGEALEGALVLSELLKSRGKEQLGFRRLRKEPETLPLVVREDGKLTLRTAPMPSAEEPDWPAPALENDVTVEKLRRAKRVRAMECQVVMLPSPVEDPQGGPPRFPFMLLSALVDEAELLNLPVVDDYAASAADLLGYFAEAVAKDGRVPASILVPDARTEALFHGFCARVGVELRRVEELTILDEVRDNMLSQLGEGEDGEAEAEDELSHEETALRRLQELSAAFDAMYGGFGPEN